MLVCRRQIARNECWRLPVSRLPAERQNRNQKDDHCEAEKSQRSNQGNCARQELTAREAIHVLPQSSHVNIRCHSLSEPRSSADFGVASLQTGASGIHARETYTDS